MGVFDWIVRLYALLVTGLHLGAGFFPEAGAWGVWSYTVLPPGVAWPLALAVASLALPPVADAVGRWIYRLWTIIPGKSHRHVWYAVVAVAAALPFWLFRIRHLRWGDAHFIVQALSYTGSDRPIWTFFNWQSPLTIFGHAYLWIFLNPITGLGVDTLYALTSVLAGVAFMYVLLLVADLLGRDRLEKAVIFGLVATTGAMQLFFGYIENYTIMSLGIVLTLYLGLRCIRAETSVLWPSLALAVTNAFHPSSIVLWPALVWLGWYVSRRRGNLEWAKLLLPPLVVFVALSGLMMAGGHGPGSLVTDDRPGGADGIPFVPLFQVTTEWQHYTMFSAAHILDWLNEHFLISPYGIFILIAVLVASLVRRRQLRRRVDGSERNLPSASGLSDERAVTVFLTIASLVYLLLTFVWNPDYGGRHDWDLFAPSAFVYTPLAAFLLIRHYIDWSQNPKGKRSLRQVALLLIASSALHTAAWVYYNAIPWPY